MAEVQVSIIGLGRTGASLGLALKRYNQRKDASNQFHVTGYDSRPSVEKTARERQAIDQTANTLESAASDKDLVVVTAPLSEAERVFMRIGKALREGAVVLDFSLLKTVPIGWATTHFPEGTYLIGATAIVNPDHLFDGLDDTEHATADLFDGGALLLAPAATVNTQAVSLVTTLADLLGVPSHFVDPAEHDGVIAATEGLPALMGAALLRTLSLGQGWAEVQRATNPAFGRITHRLLDTTPEDISALLNQNAPATVRQLDLLIETLGELREVLAAGHTDAVQQALVDAEEQYGMWLKKRSQGKWDAFQDMSQVRATGSFMTGLLGNYLSERLLGNRGKSDADN